jgi:hypothetical protein
MASEWWRHRLLGVVSASLRCGLNSPVGAFCGKIHFLHAEVTYVLYESDSTARKYLAVFVKIATELVEELL